MPTPLTLSTHDSMVLLVDMQSALLPAIHESQALLSRASRLLRAAQLLGVPVFATEHCADKIGGTSPELKPLVDHVIHKTHFDATLEQHFQPQLPTGRSRVLLIGTEAHVCVLQTGLGLARLGLQPVLVTDCIGSRKVSDHRAACHRWADRGLERISAEMAMFEWLGSPAHPQFREVLALIKAG
ncbi:isochorismatase family protein [Allopusillimonas ginsengisoli]|uniref:isochorismatase family protein n=1 Tax=Allopusillimonas ginsengisoli TaxID=453575 RepID=UPI00101FC1F1|nr:isochorismatase family protein [Allopusillimonas ginsengisoli]TEA77477.1 isochorismatase family protein [Allopusillimonas ginsengisoli]